MVQFTQVIFWFSVAFAALVQPLFLAQVLRSFRRAGGATGVLDTLRGRLGCWRRRGGEDTSVDKQVQDLVTKLLAARRVSFARTALGGAWRVLCITAWARMAEGIAEPDQSTDIGFAVSRVGWIVALVLTTCAALFPNTLVTERVLPVWLCVAASVDCSTMLALPFSGAGIGDFFVSWPKRSLYVMFLGALCLDFRWLCVVNLVFSANTLVSYGSFDVGCTEDLPTLGDVMIEEFNIFMGKTIVLYCAEWAMTYGAHKEVEVALGTCHGSAVSALLGLMCDAVVDLDSTWCLKEHVKKLGGMLMHGPSKSLAGAKFADFIASPEDRERFARAVEESVSPAPGVDPMPHMITVRLRDAMGHTFSVSLYRITYCSVEGWLNHLIGIQEPVDESHGSGLKALRSQRPLPAARLAPGVQEALCACSKGSPAAAVAAAESGSLSPSAVSVSRSSTSRAADDEHMLLGSLRVAPAERLPVVSGDEELRRRLKISEPGKCLADAVAQHGDHLANNILAGWEKAKSGVEQPNPDHIGNYMFLLRGGKASGTECQVSAHYPDAGAIATGGDDSLQVDISVVNLKRRQNWHHRMGPLLTMASGHGSDGPEQKGPGPMRLFL